MRNLFIEFRKKYILPKKWRKQKYNKAQDIELPKKVELLDRLEELKKEFHVFKRQNRQDDMNKSLGKIELIEELIDEKID